MAVGGEKQPCKNERIGTQAGKNPERTVGSGGPSFVVGHEAKGLAVG